MKKYTITDKEWESVLNKVQTLEKENQRLTGVIEGMNKAFSLYGVVSCGQKYTDSFRGLCKCCEGNGWIDKTP